MGWRYVWLGGVGAMGLAACGPQLEPIDGGGSTSAAQSTGVMDSEPPPGTSAVGTSSSSVTSAGPGPTTDAVTSGPTTVDVEPSGSSGSPSDSSSGDSSSGEPAPLDCAGHCDSLSAGSCLADDFACARACAQAIADQGTVVADAFESCVSTEPLCFSSLEDCMWATLFGDAPVEQEYRFEGSGFDAWEGRQVYSQLSAESLLVPGTAATIVGGEFAVDATVTLPFNRLYNPRDVYLFVDIDGDGVCTPGIDHAQTVWMMSLGFDFDAPSFVLSGMPSEVSSDFVCGQF